MVFVVTTPLRMGSEQKTIQIDTSTRMYWPVKHFYNADVVVNDNDSFENIKVILRTHGYIETEVK